VAAADEGTRRQPHRDRARSARLRRIFDAGRELHQGRDGAGRARAGREPEARPRRGRRPRHRADGGLRLCRAIPGRGRPHRADGRVPAGRGQLAGCLAAARPVALPLLRQDAAGAGGRPRTDLLRALLERLRGRPGPLDPGAGPALLRQGLRAARPDARQLRGLPRLSAGRARFRRLREDAARDADAGAERREGFGADADHAGPAGRDPRRRRDRARRWWTS
jgi:hypothetical protein